MSALVVGITSLLDSPLAAQVRGLWTDLERDYGWRAVQRFPHPNLSFQGGLCEDLPALTRDWSDWAGTVLPFEIAVDGLGYFTTPHRVIFLRVVPSPALRRIHSEANELLARHCRELFRDYRPERWTPHITLAMEDPSEEDFERARARFSDWVPTHRQAATSLSLVCQRLQRGPFEIVRTCTLES